MARPRTVSLKPEEMIALGEEMIKWVKANEGTILHLSEWYTIEKGYIYNEWKQFISKEEFHPYYERCLRIIGKRYLDKDSNIRENASQRFLRSYFADLREREDKEADERVERESKIKTDIPPLTNIIDLENENMMLKAEIEKLKSK